MVSKLKYGNTNTFLFEEKEDICLLILIMQEHCQRFMER